MGNRVWLPALVAAVCVTALHAGVASAQVTVQVNQDGSPASGVNMSLMLNGIKTARGATGADGRGQVDEPVITQGTPIEVYVRTCDGELTEVIHVPPNEVLPKDEECDDDPAGAYRWGENAEIVVDVTPAGPALTALPGPGYRPIWMVGAGPNWVHFPELENQVCDQSNVTDCSVDDTGLGFSTFVEFQILPRLAFGTRYSYNTASTDQHYVYQGAPVVRESDLDVNTLQAYAKPVFSLTPRFKTGFLFGWGWFWNSMTSRETGPGGDTADFERDDSGGRILLGWEADWFPTDRAGMRIGASVSSGGPDDADTRYAVSAEGVIQIPSF